MREGMDGNVMAFSEFARERHRQIYVEGHDPIMDDRWTGGELSRAAAAYLLSNSEIGSVRELAGEIWPFGEDQFKSKDYRKDLVRAGSLILAEIERLDRAAV